MENYSRRLRLAAGLSLLTHLVLLVMLVANIAGSKSVLRYEEPPLVLHLQPPPAPPEPEPEPRQVVDDVAAADRAVERADLIAEHDSNAASAVEASGDLAAPRAEVIDDFEVVPSPPPTAPIPPEPVVKEQPRATEKPKPKQPAKPPVLAKAENPPAPADQVAPASPKRLAQGEETPPRKSRGRMAGGAKNKGFVSFEAIADELAPYLKGVRDRVEREWLRMLSLTYTGTASSEAVLDVVIRPDGTVESITIVSPGESINYAALCRKSVEKAGPFAPFPFKVPDMYRDKNLEIRWTFNFM